MPIKKRRWYFLFFLVIFLVTIPPLILYTSGYRLSENYKLVKTGGILIYAPGSGTEIYINNKIGRVTNIFQHSFFEQNLTPGIYFVFVYKEGYWPWSKELRVHEQVVTDANAFLVPKEPKIEEIPKNLPITNVGTSGEQNPLYVSINALFYTDLPVDSAKLTTSSAAATTTVIQNNTKLTRDGDTIYSEWLGDQDKAPSYFCNEYKLDCVKKINIFTSPTKIKTFDFYPGRDDVVLLARKNGIYAVEADQRKIQNFVLVYAGGDPDFRIGSDGVLYVKNGISIFRVTL